VWTIRGVFEDEVDAMEAVYGMVALPSSITHADNDVLLAHFIALAGCNTLVITQNGDRQ
jgi:hypothetical protein